MHDSNRYLMFISFLLFNPKRQTEEGKTEYLDNFEFSVCFFPKRKHAGNTYKLVISMNL